MLDLIEKAITLRDTYKDIDGVTIGVGVANVFVVIETDVVSKANLVYLEKMLKSDKTLKVRTVKELRRIEN